MWKIVVTFAILGFAGIQAQEEFCIQCSSSAMNSDCVYPERLANFTQTCGNLTGLCFTRVIHDGQIQRGCGSEIDSTECSGELCSICPLASGTSVACNDQPLPVDRLTCYTCTGNRTSTCGAMNGTLTEERSVMCPLYLEGDRCVATRRNDIVERGCFSSMHSVNCDITHNCCMGHGCNHMDWDLVLTGAAVSISSVLKIVTIALFGVIVGYNNL
ncbi:unnamed protein product [Chironomus riparius]|uniref:DUF753 domain-containing protein n=1 Tax=Chironomus riparius TaxID=315576 RepID=A0A9N9RXJ6_9DIPT|nr:unnamed protein product [Chironomus riparius]